MHYLGCIRLIDIHSEIDYDLIPIQRMRSLSLIKPVNFGWCSWFAAAVTTVGLDFVALSSCGSFSWRINWRGNYHGRLSCRCAHSPTSVLPYLLSNWAAAAAGWMDQSDALVFIVPENFSNANKSSGIIFMVIVAIRSYFTMQQR